MNLHHVIYLHGFASSPDSTKAAYYRPVFESRGLTYHVPDLNAPSFERLTLTAMLERVAETVDRLPEGDVALIGSSMGGLTAVHFLDRYREQGGRRVRRLVLMAPALDFRRTGLGADLDQWRAQGQADFFNYSLGTEMTVHYGLVEDLMGYDSSKVHITLPTIIFHGQHDDTVPHELSFEFSQRRPNVQLRLLDSDHQMLEVTDKMEAEMLEFLELDA